jgi:hypothetical protein
MSTSKTLMTYDQMTLGRAFTPLEFSVDQHMLDGFAAITSMPLSPAPAGLLAIFARRAYLTDGEMPSGGVMASLEIGVTAPLRPGRPLVARAVVTERQERKGRGWVTIDVRFSDGSTEIATARVLGVWPL